MTDALAVDLSNYTPPLSADHIRCWKANNVELAIVQAINRPAPQPTPQQLQVCAEGALDTDAYILPFETTGLDELRARRSMTRGYHLGRWWLDLEEPMSLDYVRWVLAEMDTWDAVDNQVVGIYSAPWWWNRQAMGWWPTEEFAHRPLWGMQQNLLRPFVPFGGWTTYAIRQYWLDANLCGVTGIDVSVINPEYLRTRTQPKEQHMIRLGEGLKNRLANNGDEPMFGHVFREERDDDNQAYTVEEVYGTKGRYVASNVNGPDKWLMGGPF